MPNNKLILIGGIALGILTSTTAQAQVCDSSSGSDCVFIRMTGSSNPGLTPLFVEDATTGGTTFAIEATSTSGKAIRASSPDIAIWAQTHNPAPSNRPAIYGFNNVAGMGVKGESSSGTGIYGLSATGNGVNGQSSSNSGVFAVSNSGFGLAALSTSNNAINAASNQVDGIIGTGGSSSGAAGVHGRSNGVNGFSLFGSGDMKIVAFGSQTGTATKPGGGSWIAPSDSRIKKDVTPFSAGLTELAAVRPVRYKYNGLGGTRDDGKEYIGVIAQDLEKVMPNMVRSQKAKLRPTDTKEIDLKEVDPNAFTYALINSVNQLAARNEELRRRLERVESKRPALAGLAAEGSIGAAGIGLGLGLALARQRRKREG